MMRRSGTSGAAGMAKLPWILSGLLAGALMAMSLMHGPLSAMNERMSESSSSAMRIAQLQETVSQLRAEV